VNGFHHLPGYWDGDTQRRAVETIRQLCHAAPLARPSTPAGRPMHVQITSAGAAAWWSDTRGGYRYLHTQPNGAPLPEAPQWILDAARVVVMAATGAVFAPDAVLINYYAPDASLSCHRDESEPDLDAPIVSFSLGAACPFHIRGPERDDRVSEKVVLESGDAVVMSGPSRNWYHEVPRIMASDPMFSPLRGGGRISILVRKVT
jgi:alkylated DNA repair protein (DNA oxidative demethylase)